MPHCHLQDGVDTQPGSAANFKGQTRGVEKPSHPSSKGVMRTAGWWGGKEKIYPLRSRRDFRAGAFGHQSDMIVVFDEEKGPPGPNWQGLN